jgi:hypothetical protein
MVALSLHYVDSSSTTTPTKAEVSRSLPQQSSNRTSSQCGNQWLEDTAALKWVDAARLFADDG